MKDDILEWIKNERLDMNDKILLTKAPKTFELKCLECGNTDKQTGIRVIHSPPCMECVCCGNRENL